MVMVGAVDAAADVIAVADVVAVASVADVVPVAEWPGGIAAVERDPLRFRGSSRVLRILSVRSTERIHITREDPINVRGSAP